VNLRLPIAAAIILLGGAAGFLAAHLARVARTQGLVDTTPTAPPAAVLEQIPQGASETAGASSNKPIPTNVPDISLADLKGVKHKLSEWKGRPVLINFWATWCDPCRREIPLLKKLRQEHAAEGIEVIGIAVDFRDAVQHYSRDMGIDYPVLVGERDGLDAIAAFGMDTVFPFTVFADRQGRIVTLKIGELHADESRFILEVLGQVDRGQTELPAARKQITDGMAALAKERALHEDHDSG
jgi:thiol-disulfide isomerase/thioredoxin